MTIHLINTTTQAVIVRAEDNYLASHRAQWGI